MTMSNKRGVAGAAILATLLAPGCNQTTSTPTRATYHVITHGEPDNDFWIPLIIGMEQAGVERSVETQFFGAIASSTSAPEQQAAQIRQSIAEGVDGIGVTLTDLGVLAGPLAEAREAGIPVIAVNIPATEEELEAADIEILTYVGQIETVMAEKAALRAYNQLADQGRTMDVAVCIQGSVSLAWAVQRCQGMTDALAPLGVRVDILRGNFFASPPDVPEDEIEGWFQDNPDVDFVFATAAPPLSLVLSYVASGLVASDVMLGSVDLDTVTLEAVRDGRVAFAVDQQPYMQGYMTIITLELHREVGLRPGADIQTGPFFVEAGNVDDIAFLVEQRLR